MTYNKKNYWLHLIEGGFIMGAVHFVSSQTVLPNLLKQLDCPDIYISLMPVALFLGFLIPPIFTAHLLENRKLELPIIKYTTIIQRLPYLWTGLILIYGDNYFSNQMIAIVVLTCPFISGLFGGVTLPAWQHLLKKTVDQKRISSMLAFRFIMSCGIGLFAGWVVNNLMKESTGLQIYGWLHLIAFVFMVLSYVLFILLEEKESKPAPQAKRKLSQTFKRIPELLKEEKLLKTYIVQIFLKNVPFFILPFMAIYFKDVYEKNDSYMGLLLSAQMSGSILGNFTAAYFGDKFGPRFNLLLSTGSFVIMCVTILFIDNEFCGIICFFLSGITIFVSSVGNTAMSLFLSSQKFPSTFYALISLCNAISFLFFAIASSWFWNGTGSFNTMILLSLITGLITIFFTLKLPSGYKKSYV